MARKRINRRKRGGKKNNIPKFNTDILKDPRMQTLPFPVKPRKQTLPFKPVV